MSLCTKCLRGEPVYHRRYSGEKLCARCFLRSIESQAKKVAAQHRMFRPDDRIAVAVSGGKDSLALLHVMEKIERRFPEAELVAITVDEGIAGYRSEALSLAKALCSQLGVEHVAISFRECFGHDLDEIVKAAENRSGLAPCSFCGVLRRRALNNLARRVEADKVATAHNLDDEAQTMLLNLIHGDVNRVSRVEPVIASGSCMFVRRVKPFCETPENEIALYANLIGIPFQSVPCPYVRSALRNEVRNMLNRLEVRHPGSKFTIVRAFERIRPALKASALKAELKECKLCGEPTVSEVCKPCECLAEIGLTSL